MYLPRCAAVPGSSLEKSPRFALPILLALTVAVVSAHSAEASEREVGLPRPFPPGQAINPYEALDRLGQGLAIVEENYVDAPDRERLVMGALRGLVGELDPHSTYLSPEALKLFDEDTSGSFGGIGVEVDIERGEAIIIAPVEGSPADRAGIVAGDSIVRLGGVPLSERKPEEIITAMRGPIGSVVWLTIRSKAGEYRELELRREAIWVRSVKSARLVDNLLYLRIKSFQAGTHAELTDRISEFRRANGPEAGVVLDLRNNPGGLVREATAVADEFLSQGLIFETRHRGKVDKQQVAHRGGAVTKAPLVILVNEYSASAAELVAAALKDNGRGKVVGARTFGKGSVQTVLGLSANSAVKLTTALYYSPSGRTLQAQGVVPDYAVDPGYVKGSPVVAERDLPGHIPGGRAPDGNPASLGERSAPAALPSAPPTNDQVHHGVLRNLVEDPRNGPDRALSFAVTLLRGEAKPEAQGAVNPTSAPVSKATESPPDPN